MTIIFFVKVDHKKFQKFKIKTWQVGFYWTHAKGKGWPHNYFPTIDIGNAVGATGQLEN